MWRPNVPPEHFSIYQSMSDVIKAMRLAIINGCRSQAKKIYASHCCLKYDESLLPTALF
jgi:hypothetical protein